LIRSIQCIRPQITRSDAERAVADVSGQAARVERSLYYPYLWYRLRYGLTTLFGQPRFEAECLVDGRKGLVSTTEAFETIELRPAAADLLELRQDPDSGALAARRTLSHLLTKQFRTLTAVELETAGSQLVYKEFWVLRCGAQGPSVLVDSTTERFIALTGAGVAA